MERHYDRPRYVLIMRTPREVEICLEDQFLGLLGATKPLMGYHISLVGSFFMPGDGDPDTLMGIDGVCRRWQPFHIELDGLSGFRSPDNNSATMDLENPEPVQALQRALVEVLLGQIEFVEPQVRQWNLEGFAPHITLGLGLSDQRFEELLRTAGQRNCRIGFEATAVSLVCKAPGGPWQHLASYPLGVTEADERDSNPSQIYH